MVDDVGPDDADTTETGIVEDERDERRRSAIWAGLALVVLILLIMWLLWQYLGGRLAGAPTVKSTSSEISLGATPTSNVPSTTDSETPSTEEDAGVPDVVGMSRSAAISAIEGAGYAASVRDVFGTSHPSNTVIHQNPSARSKLEQGGTVGLLVQMHPSSAPVVRVPKIVGLSESAAKSRLEALGFNVVISYTPNPKNPGHVYSQWPLPGSSLPEGGDVQLQVMVTP